MLVEAISMSSAYSGFAMAARVCPKSVREYAPDAPIWEIDATPTQRMKLPNVVSIPALMKSKQ